MLARRPRPQFRGAALQFLPAGFGRRVFLCDPMKQPKHLTLPRPVPILDEPDEADLSQMLADFGHLHAEYGGEQVYIEDLIALQRVEDA